MTKARDIASAAPAPSTVSATELGYLDGVTSAIQTQIDGKSGTSHNHDSAYLNQSVIDAKGDLLVGTADNAYGRLAAGDAGSTLVADSSTTTGLRWQADWNTGKNKIINGDFNINQRGFSSQTTEGFIFDRFYVRISGDGTVTSSAQTFTPGAAPVAGYEGANYVRIVTSGQTSAAVRTALRHPVENVRTFAGQTVTVSFWARATSGTPKVALLLAQVFGTGGSAGVDNPVGFVTISTSWTRYSLTTTLPSISGKTIGTDSRLLVDLAVSAGSDLSTPYSSIGIQNNTFEFWGIQAEAGQVATPFTTASGTLQGELALCQRYYWRNTITSGTGIGIAIGRSTTQVDFYPIFPVMMRTRPTALEFGGTGNITDVGVQSFAITSATFSTASTLTASIRFNAASGITQGKTYIIEPNTDFYIGFSGEL